MTGMFGFLRRAIARRLGAVVLSVAVLTSVTIAASSGARADWNENRSGCTYLCHWYLTTGTCTGPFNVHVPCPLKKKRCSVDFCTQSQS
jgi:hypothetical protein